MDINREHINEIFSNYAESLGKSVESLTFEERMQAIEMSAKSQATKDVNLYFGKSMVNAVLLSVFILMIFWLIINWL